MATRIVTETNKRLVFLAMCAFHDGEFAQFSLDNLSSIGISKDGIASIIKEIARNGDIMDMTIPGFFKRIKIINVEPCPDFVFNTDLTVGMRELLVDCYDKLDSFEPRTAIALAKELNYTKSLSTMLTNIKTRTDKSIFTLLDESKSITRLPWHDKYPLVKKEEGCQIDSYPQAAQYRTMSFSEAYQARKHNRIVNSGIGHYLMQKIKTSAHRRVGKLEVAVTEEYLQELYEKQGGRDFYTGLEIPKLEDISVDRINNELGYIEGNLVLTTKEINMFRRDRSVDKFIELCSQVANHFNNK